MKHLLNDLTEKEKNSIREQHTGGMKVVTENFSKLINAKSGDVKPLVTEDESSNGYSNLEKCATSFQKPFKIADIGGKYEFSMIRKSPDGTYDTIDSQQNPDIVSVRRVTGKDRNERVVYGGELKFKGKSCMELEREINNLLSKRITPN